MSTTDQTSLDRLKAARTKREPKTRKPIAKVSDKKKAELKEEKEKRGDSDPEKEVWFKARRREMKGYCGCGCGERSSKNDDQNYRGSIAHILPKDPEYGFPSVATHPLNWIERRLWGGCHTNMDQMGLARWVNMEDWPIIRERFLILEKCLTPEEKTKNFYHLLKELVENNPA